MTCSYVLITPARNEEAHLEAVLRSVTEQTVLPERWVIVSDGSTDGTDRIALTYVARFPFIRFIRLEHGRDRDFASKAHAVRAGCKALEGADYAFIGNLDADVAFGKDYFSTLIERFDAQDRLGIAGGIIVERIKDRFVPQKTSLDSVAGAVQLFRRECFEAIGGYRPLQYGGIDAAAEITARMAGWEVKTFPDLKVLHPRRVASSASGILRARLRQGRMHYVLGYHPLFEALRCFYRLLEPPVLLGGALVFTGYLAAALRRLKFALPREVILYHRAEQTKKLKSLLRLPGRIRPVPGRSRYSASSGGR